MPIAYRRKIGRRFARTTSQLRRRRAHGLWIAAVLLLACAFSPLVISAQTDADTPAPASPQVPVMEADPSAKFLENGYRHLYELKFDDARLDFVSYQKARPDDPLGKASEAACYLFEQFHAASLAPLSRTTMPGLSRRTVRPANRPRLCFGRIRTTSTDCSRSPLPTEWNPITTRSS
jgi:hypothetical protein